jgi:hypothetical protein
VIVAGFTRKRSGKGGKIGFQALYDDARGVRQTTGTFVSEKAADKAWQAAEAKIAEGKSWDPRRGRQKFGRYVEETWLPNHRIELSTKQDYVSALKRHILPYFGDMKMQEITSQDVRAWLVEMREKGVGAPRRGTSCARRRPRTRADEQRAHRTIVLPIGHGGSQLARGPTRHPPDVTSWADPIGCAA